MRVINPSERVVAAGEPLMEIADPADLEIVVDFLSADAVQIRAGQSVVIEGWGGNEDPAGCAWSGQRASRAVLCALWAGHA